MRYPDTFETIWDVVKPFTMTSKNRGFALYEAVNHILDSGIQGAFVECGVWRGGSSMIIALTLLERNITNRRIVLFDTFSGMTAPTDKDCDPSGQKAADILAQESTDGLTYAICDLETVRKNMISTGYPRQNIAYIKGDVCETLPHKGIQKVSLLRLDTDFYESTRTELTHLYPNVSVGGVVIIDDYGHWQGARQAADEFLQAEKRAGYSHFLIPLDYTGRLFIKPAPRVEAADIKRQDYISPTLLDPGMVGRFKNLKETNPTPVKWPYLRRDVPHIWRTDSRSKTPNIGVLSVDEGAVLYNAALPFKGKRGLEIGCHLAFSTAHLTAAGVQLDVIDPALADPSHLAAVQSSLAEAVPSHEVTLHAGFSPGIVSLVYGAKPQTPWSFVFIDGLHDGIAPLNDAQAVAPFMAETAAVMFHDLTCPDVAEGLRYYADLGWQTQIYETMQIMGIAWRGDYVPPEHIAHAGASSKNLAHLARWHT